MLRVDYPGGGIAPEVFGTEWTKARPYVDVARCAAGRLAHLCFSNMLSTTSTCSVDIQDYRPGAPYGTHGSHSDTVVLRQQQ